MSSRDKFLFAKQDSLIKEGDLIVRGHLLAFHLHPRYPPYG